MAYKYFIFSATQLRERTAIERNIGRAFKPGEVVVGPRRLQFTELNNTGTSRYSDAKIVAEGEESAIKYTKIRSV